MKYQTSDTGVRTAHVSYKGDAERIFIHIVPEKKKYPSHPVLLQLRYCRRDGEGWDILPNGSLDLKEGDSKNNTAIKTWLAQIGMEDQARPVWNLYVNLRDGRI